MQVKDRSLKIHRVQYILFIISSLKFVKYLCCTKGLSILSSAVQQSVKEIKTTINSRNICPLRVQLCNCEGNQAV